MPKPPVECCCRPAPGDRPDKGTPVCDLTIRRLASEGVDDGDEPRYLGMRVGYVRHAARGMRGEGEAITALEQDQQTRDAQRAASDRDKAEWLESRARLQREIAWLYSRRFQQAVGRQLAALQRQVDRLDGGLSRR